MALYPQNSAGKSIQKIYKRIGIRRDRNFSDLSNPTAGLENLLDTLVDDSSFNFLSTDLGAIKNIFARGLTNDNYLRIAGSAVKFTTPDGVTSEFNPRITYQNRLDKIQVFSGIPRLAGGNGLTAKYYQNDQINFNEHSDFKYNVDPNPTSSTNINSSSYPEVFTDTTNEGLIEDDTFWEAGNFSYTENVHPQSAKVNTGVKWEGYFIPTITGKVTFTTLSTSYFTVDFEQVGYKEDSNGTNISGIGTYKEHVRIGLSTSIAGISSVSSNEIVVDPTQSAQLEKMNTIGTRMTVTHPSIAVGTIISNERGFDKETGVINLEPPAESTDAVIAPISNVSMTFSRELGDLISHSFNTQVLIAYQKYRIRYRYFNHKNFEAKNIERNIDMNYRQSNMNVSTHLRYNHLFSLDYDFSDSAKGDFNRYSDNSVLFGGTNIYSSPVGLGNTTDNSKYIKVKSRNKVDVTYKVKQVLGSDTGSKITGITRRSTSCTLESGSPVVSLDLTTDIEIGNYVFGDGIPDKARVIDLTINQFVIIDKEATVSGSKTIDFINHRGFVKKVTVVSVNNKQITVNASTPLLDSPSNRETTFTDVRKDMVAIGPGIDAIQITDVTAPSGSNGGILTLASSVSISSGKAIYIYQSRGLKDNSLLTFCGKFSDTTSTFEKVQCLIATEPVSSGDEIPVETTSDGGTPPIFSAGNINSTNIGNGNWKIQGFNFASGTEIQSISANKITLNKPITKPIVSGTQFTATTLGDDRELCCPPTDTSPPFIATEEGLNTTLDSSGNPERPNLRFESGNLVFDQLTIQNDGQNIVDQDYSSGPVNRKISIKTPLSTQPFKILGHVD